MSLLIACKKLFTISLKTTLKKTLLILCMLSIALPTIGNANERVIHFATEATYPPFVTMQPDGKIDGFETHLVKALCTEAKLHCEFHNLPFDSLLPSLAYKKIDAIYGGIGVNEERKKQVLFTDSIFVNSWGILAAKEKPLSMHEKELTGKKIGVQQGTLIENYLQKKYGSFAKIKSYASIQDAFLELKSGRLDGVLGDTPVLQYWVKNAKATQFAITELKTGDHLSQAGDSVLGFRKDEQPLVEQFNQALKKIKENGSYAKIQQQFLDQ